MRDKVMLRKPALEWVEGFPLANGISAAMLWGTPSRTVLSLNHVDFWRDNLGKSIGDYSAVTRKAQRLMLAGRAYEANELFFSGTSRLDAMPRQRRKYESIGGYTNSFQPLGNLILELDGQEVTGSYVRTLDLRNGIASVDCRLQDRRLHAECFVSAELDAVVLRISSDNPVSGRVHFERQPQDEYEYAATVDGDGILVEGRFDEGVRSAVLVVARTDGRSSSTASFVGFTDARRIDLLLTVDSGKGSTKYADICRRRMTTALAETFEKVRRRHCEEHANVFGRVELSLGEAGADTPETDLLVERASSGDYPNELGELQFGMGRYLMMSCNRGERRPANLQGIWNDNLEPEWDADWHIVTNLPMCHYLVNVVNLDECHLALFRQAELLLDEARLLARNLAGSDGILYHWIAGGDGMLPGSFRVEGRDYGGLWLSGAAWIAHHYWDHYEFTGDRDFLVRRAYPFMKLAGRFYADFLVKAADGGYVAGLSHSLEHRPPNGHWLNIHCTMDTAMVRELTRHLLEAGRILEVDRELWPIWRDLHDHILPYPISREGVLKEWPEPLAEDPAHGLFSHLYALYPSDEISDAVPELLAAARKAVYLRQSAGLAHNYGHSYPMLAAFHARLGEGDAALENLHRMARSVTFDNLLTALCEFGAEGLTVHFKFNVPRLYQVDAALVATAAMAEMLLQSHGGVIRLLPALPAKWPAGRFKGLKARGAFEVEVDWRDGRLIRAVVRSLKENSCKLRCCTPWESFQVTSGGEDVPYTLNGDATIGFATRAGHDYELRFE